MSQNKKMVSIRFENEFIKWMDIRAKAERTTRTALLEKIGWKYLRTKFRDDQIALERVNAVLDSDLDNASSNLTKIKEFNNEPK